VEYNIACKLDAVCAMEPTHFSIKNVNVRKDGIMEATDGKALVRIPCVLSKDEHPGQINPSALVQMRTAGSKKKPATIHVGEKVTIERTRRSKYAMVFDRPTDGPFPKTDEVIPKDDPSDVEYYISGPLLIKVLKAMGADRHSEREGVRFIFTTDKNGAINHRKPMRMEHVLSEGGTTTAVIMPMKIK